MRLKTGRIAALLLAVALAPVSRSQAAEFKRLPDFQLDSTRIAGLPDLPDGAIPPVPPPTDTGYYGAARAGGVRLDSSVKVVIDGRDGRAEINFPSALEREELSGFRSSLFVKFYEHNSASVLSWAAVICSGSEYLGYKGANLKLPDKAGDFILRDEGLALGPAKEFLGRTHAWVIPAPETETFQGLRWCQVAGSCRSEDQSLDRLCSAGFPGKMKGYAAKALSAAAAGYSFKYDPVKNRLLVRWRK